MRYKVLKALRSNEVKPSLWVTPVLEQVADGYRPHHVEVAVGCSTRRFVPIEHVSNHRRRILDLEDENAKLRELACRLYECMCNVDADGNHECDSCEYGNAEGDCDFGRLMRELGIEVD